MLRSKTFLNLVFGMTDSESGYGACYPKSPELKSFFLGWLGEKCPTDTAWRDYLKSGAQGSNALQRKAVIEFANRLYELADELLSECEINNDIKKETPHD